MKKSNKLYGIIYFLCVIVTLLLIKDFNIKINFGKYITADWVSALATAIAIPFSVIPLVWQLHQGTVDRRYDAQTIFSITWIKNIESQESVWVHKEIFDKHKENIEATRTSEKKIPLIKNVGGKVAQEILVKIETSKSKEYFSRTVMEKDYEFAIIPDLLFSNIKNEYINKIKIYYLSELGQRIGFEYHVKDKTVSTGVIKNWDALKERFSEANVKAINPKVIVEKKNEEKESSR